MDRLLQDPSAKASRRALIALLLLGLAATPFLWLHSYAPTLLSGGDGAIYMICAQNLLAGEGYTYLGEPFIIRPPGFSVLIMPLISLFGRDTTVLTLFVWLCGIAGLGAFFCYQRPRLGIPVSLAVCLVLFLNSFFQLAANQIMSDVPALLALFGCLLLERRARQRPSLGMDIGLGLAIAAAAYLRSVHILLLPALVLGRGCAFLRQPRTEESPQADCAPPEHGAWRALPRYFLRRIAPVLIVAIVAVLPWKLREDRVASPDVAEFTRLHSYGVALLHTDAADPGSPYITLSDLTRRVRARSSDIAGTLGSRMVQRENPTTLQHTLTILGLLAWAVVLGVRRGTGDWFVAGTLFVITIYFGFMNRLLLPVFFMVVPAVAQVLLWVLGRCCGKRLATGITTVMLLVWAVADYDANEAYQATMEKDYTAFMETSQLLRDTFGPDEAITSSRSAHFYLELDRPVFNHSWPMLRGGEQGTLEFLERHDVRGLVLAKSRRADRRLIGALGSRLQVIQHLGPYTVARLRQ
ncbi:MAG: hypothetical protein ACI8QZ_004223 [Chlamydiales bacterium]|jgi:hypothetical protein